MADALWMDESGGAPAYSGQELRLTMLGGLFAGSHISSPLPVRSGVLAANGSPLAITAQSTPDMSVRANPGHLLIQGAQSNTQGAYLLANETVTTLPVTPSNASLPRIDRVVGRILDGTVTGTTTNRVADLVVLPGTPATTPSPPALPVDGSFYVLAEITVPAGASSIINGNIADRRQFTTALGGIIPSNFNALPVSGSYGGQAFYGIDSRSLYVWNGGGYEEYLPSSKVARGEVAYAQGGALVNLTTNYAFTHSVTFINPSTTRKYQIIYGGTRFTGAMGAGFIQPTWTAGTTPLGPGVAGATSIQTRTQVTKGTSNNAATTIASTWRATGLAVGQVTVAIYVATSDNVGFDDPLLRFLQVIDVGG